MAWQVRHEGSARSVKLTLETLVEGLRDGVWEPIDEVKGPRDTTWIAIENHPQFTELVEELESPPRAPEEGTHLDMNALIDVCLVLLIFFILTTAHAAAVQKIIPLPTLDLEKQKSKGVRPISSGQVKKYMIRVQVDAATDGKPQVKIEDKAVEVALADGRIDVDKFAALVRPHVRDAAKTEMLLDARGVSWGQVVAIQDGARSAGVRVVHHLHRGAPK